MSYSIRFAFFLLVLLLINGCSTLSKSECEKGEWSKIGAKDANKGLRATPQLSLHNKACSKHKIKPDNKLYFSGYAKGLKRFCTHSNGFDYGSAGSRYIGTCPASLKPNFLDGYLSGLDLAIQEIEIDLDDLYFEKSRKHHRLITLEERDSKKGKHKDRIKKLSNRIDYLSSEISSKRSESNQLRSYYNKWAP